ncbi:peptide-methionine (S)-S-oxide reductase MsrA [Nevskia soli]|jgi:peptide-methionine (S)-S-oxide reductase|uniref:peptide-methionine (S)-S-oxide reductase MsrA n=1 Tax=Nevskia soli TaxID=418856 RepID=UPI0015D6BF94|nr:peptide-methionine (S)-S-oxide reductase MsrA [Nevskia soli]
MFNKLSLIAVAGLLAAGACGASQFPDPAVDDSLQAAKGKQVAVLAGGCFWGVEAVFEHLKGVDNVVAGFAGGERSTAHYEEVSTGTTGHAESVQITYDPAKITYGQILKVYFSVAHDPTELNRQGPDSGTQYRSSIFYANDDQKRIAEAYIHQLNEAHVFRSTIATQVVPLKGFYAAEAYHQHYADLHPDNPYISTYDLPKVADLKKQYPQMCKR